ncbi:MAG: hypothetical protein ABIN67_06460 [Ferruginibacter sp.]
MKIENIINDIIDDTIEIKNKLEDKIRRMYPDLDFTLALPGLQQLSAIKVIEISIVEENIVRTFGVDLHTHNGHRVFEHNPSNGNENRGASRHIMQDALINLLREIIKKRKSQKAHSRRSISSMI